MPIIRAEVENATELLNTSYLGAGALGRVERSATGGGVGFSEISTFALVAGTRVYTVYDLAGAVTSWYRIRFSKSDGTSPSEYGDEFQAGDETAGLLCSLYDVEQRLFGTATAGDNEREILLEIIRQVSDDMEDYVGRWLAPRPTSPTSTQVLLFDVDASRGWSRSLRLVNSHRLCGIRTLTALGIATTSQPESGGTYTAATLADVLLRPRPTADGPATRLEFSDIPTGPVSFFYPGYNTVQATGSFGPSAVAPRIQMVAIDAVSKRYKGKETGVPQAEGVLIRGISPEDMGILDRLRVLPVG